MLNMTFGPCSAVQSPESGGTVWHQWEHQRLSFIIFIYLPLVCSWLFILLGTRSSPPAVKFTFDYVHCRESCLAAVCGAKHGQCVQGYFPQTWESCLRDHLEPESGGVSYSKRLFQRHICLEINQLHLERPSIFPFEGLCDLFWEPTDICD